MSDAIPSRVNCVTSSDDTAASSIRQVDGLEVHIEGQGSETIIMLHGWPDTYRVWDSQAELLKPNYRCVRFTLPSFEKGTARQLYSLEQITQFIDKVVDSVADGKPVTLLLHDWGCFYGYQYYLRHKDKVSKIVGVDIGDAGSKNHILSGRTKAMLLSYQLWLAAAWKIGGRIGDSMTRMMARAMKAPGDMALITSSMNYPYYWKWSHTFTGRPLGILPLKIECPLLYMYGINKPGMFHSDAWIQKMSSLKGNKIAAFECLHWVMIEAESQFNTTLLEWLGEHDMLET